MKNFCVNVTGDADATKAMTTDQRAALHCPFDTE